MKTQEEIQEKMNDLLEEGLSLPSSKGMDNDQMRNRIEKLEKINNQVSILAWVLTNK